MKKQLFLTISLLAALVFIFTGCEQLNGPSSQSETILPESFSIDIPDAISFEDSKSTGTKSVQPLNGNLIYRHLAHFIKVGEHGGEMVEDIIIGIGRHNINQAMSLSYTSDDDGRIKNLDVTENPFFEGSSWEFQLTITDAESEGNEDNGNAIQIFWNRNPRKGVSIMKPYNIDRSNYDGLTDAVFRIDYSEAGERGYDAHMLVAASGLPLADPLDNAYSLNTLKMFVGKSGDVIDVYGNSNHPNAKFFTSESGFNWAFVASGSRSLDIGVAEVGLPGANLDEPSRVVLLEDYSIKNVFTDQIYEVWPDISQQSIDTYLLNTEAPGFFNNGGFVQGGTSPGEEYDALLTRLLSLSPYNPKEIADMDISFMN